MPALHQPMSSDKALSGIYNLLLNRRPQVPSVSFTRPDDTTAYTAGDAIYPPPPAEGDAPKGLELENALTYTSTGVIVTAKMICYNVTPGTKLAADLMLFGAPLETAPTDNNAFSVSAADMENYVATISFADTDAQEISGHTLYDIAVTQPIWSHATSLYGVLVAQNGYTPTAEESMKIILGSLPRDYDVL